MEINRYYMFLLISLIIPIIGFIGASSDIYILISLLFLFLSIIYLVSMWGEKDIFIGWSMEKYVQIFLYILIQLWILFPLIFKDLGFGGLIFLPFLGLQVLMIVITIIVIEYKDNKLRKKSKIDEEIFQKECNNSNLFSYVSLILGIILVIPSIISIIQTEVIEYRIDMPYGMEITLLLGITITILSLARIHMVKNNSSLIGLVTFIILLCILIGLFQLPNFLEGIKELGVHQGRAPTGSIKLDIQKAGF
jgi:hypothetical protein